MEKMTSGMIRLVSEEKAAYEQILELSARKKDVLIKGDVVLLGEIVKDEIEVLNRIRQWENKREALSAAMAEQCGLAEGQLSMDELIRRASGEKRQELIRLKEEFGKLIEKIAAVNDANKKLIHMQLKYTSFFLNMVTGEMDIGNTYDNAGLPRDVRPGRTGLMDQQI